MVSHAIDSKVWYFKNHGLLNHWLYDPTCLKQIRNVLGGRIRVMVSGGAPLDSNIKQYLTAVFAAPIFEAYGMTEAAGCISCTAYWER